ncbi:Crp/Fnr family transcriptional regulator, partial [bacterium]|nr:Crp/Fnr family transcriptional regulator [bacterium]
SDAAPAAPAAPADGDAAPGALLDDDALRALAGSCRMVRFTTDEVLFLQGDPPGACYVVESGSVRGEIAYHEGGAAHVFEFVASPGDLVGEMSLFTGMERTATGRIPEETVLLEIPKDAFARLLGRDERIIDAVSQLVAARNRENAEFLAKIASLPATDLETSCDAGRIRAHLQGLAAWGRRIIGVR